MQITPPSVLCIGIGENTADTITRLANWHDTCSTRNRVTFIHLNTEAEVDSMSLENKKLAVVLFDTQGAELASRLAKTRQKEERTVLLLGVAFTANIPETSALGIDSIAVVSDKDSLFNTARAILSPLVLNRRISDGYEDVSHTIGDDNNFLAYQAEITNPSHVGDLVSQVLTDAKFCKLTDSKRAIVMLTAASDTLSSISMDAVSHLSELLDTFPKTAETLLGIYTDDALRKEVVRLDIITTSTKQ